MAFISLIMASGFFLILLGISIIGVLTFITGLVFLTVYLIGKKKKALRVSAIIMLCVSIPLIGVLPGFIGILQYVSTPPKTFTIDNVVYRNGFYGDLWPNDLTYKGDTIEVGRNKFHRVDCEQFDWVAIEGTIKARLYCAEVQWEQARTYYSDSDNFTYYGVRGSDLGHSNPVTDIDPEKFDELLSFVQKNRNRSVGSNKNGEIIRLPMPDSTKNSELYFFRNSNDGYFTSDRGDEYYIVDGKLLYVCHYDFANGENGELVAAVVPAEIGQYFIKLFKSAEPTS